MSRRLNILITVLVVAAVFMMFETSGEPVARILRGTLFGSWLQGRGYANTIAFNLSVGFLVSVFFWLLVVNVPERARRRLLKSNFQRRYTSFKQETIGILLFASKGSYTSGEPEELCDYRKFKDYFSANKSQPWYDVLNGLESKPELMSDLIAELEIFADDLGYVLNTVSVEDPDIHQLFRSLKAHIYRLGHSGGYKANQVKLVAGFIWELFAHWSVVSGYQHRDVIQDAIKRL